MRCWRPPARRPRWSASSTRWSTAISRATRAGATSPPSTCRPAAARLRSSRPSWRAKRPSGLRSSRPPTSRWSRPAMMRYRLRPLGYVLLLVLIGATAERALAQPSDYPSRPVTFIVPFAPGGVTSLFARVLGTRLEQRLGKPFVIENRPGGGGVTAAAAVAHGTPDGYTIMMASSTVLASTGTMRKNLPYDPSK